MKRPQRGDHAGKSGQRVEFVTGWHMAAGSRVGGLLSAVHAFRAALPLVMLLVAACASPGPETLAQTETVAGARLVTVYVATTREWEGHDRFTADRSERLGFAAYTISIPPTHETTEIEWPHGSIDPRTDFAVVEKKMLGEKEFLRAVGSASQEGRTDGSGSAGVFVHGYNTNFPESLFRLAQLSADAGPGETPILFAWPSEGRIFDYVADKEATAYSRDYLVHLLTILTGERGTGKVTLAAHSMGAWLTVEALRQLRLMGRDEVLRQVGQVVLAAPDIEVAVFRQQMGVIGPMDPAITVLVSPHDRVLAMSRALAGGRARLGSVDVGDPRIQALTRQAHVQILDISAVPAQDPLHHDRFVSLAGLAGKLDRQERQTFTERIGQVGAFALGSAGSTLSGPFVWAADVVSP